MTALLKEIGLQQPYLAGETVNTIYFGGGTPSLLDTTELQSILEALHHHFNIAPDAEITLEANPDDITEEKLLQWKQAGVNRLSIGVQSFFEEDLRWMNRAHNAIQAREQLELARRYFDNITIDLIYGTPTLSDERWKQNVDTALTLGITHLSCYALTVEPKTALDTMIRKKQMAEVQPDDQARQFLLLMEWMEAAGFEHYEISNFALPGHRSRHNSAYWQGHRYLGLGPSAHSFNGIGRQWNIANNALYIQSLKKDVIPTEEEVLTQEQKLNEYIMTSLRTLEGMHLANLSALSSDAQKRSIEKNSRRFIEQGLLIDRDGWLVLSRQGKLFADGIAGDLFV